MGSTPDLEAIRARADGLEGGAWYVGARECLDGVDLYRLPVLVEGSAEADSGDVRVAAVDYRTFGYQYPHGDAQQLADFVAHARTDVPALLAMVEVLIAERDDHEKRYLAVQKVLDGAIGTAWGDGAGAGLVADVALLAQRYRDLKARVLAGGWPLVIEEVEAAELREEDTNE